MAWEGKIAEQRRLRLADKPFLTGSETANPSTKPKPTTKSVLIAAATWWLNCVARFARACLIPGRYWSTGASRNAIHPEATGLQQKFRGMREV